MSNNEKYMWTNYYMEFADKLLEYKNNRQVLLEKIVRLWDNINMDMPTLELDNDLVDIDPFTIFGLFNKHITFENRISILNFFKDEFSIISEVPQMFDGIPVVNNQQATFYSFKDKRKSEDINNLWNIFESAIELVNEFNGDNKNKFINNYNMVLNQRGIKWNITMALYWIRPFNFINLDSTNRHFLGNPDKFNSEIANKINALKEPPKAKEYLSICVECINEIEEGQYIFNNLPELSAEAFIFSTNSSEEKTEGIGDSSNDEGINYWLYSPGHGASKWDKYYQNGVMGIWNPIGNLNNYNSILEIRDKLREVNESNSNFPMDRLALWNFSKIMKEGDIVFVKKGVDTVLGYGIVTSDYFYDDSFDEEYLNNRRVNWKERCEIPIEHRLITKIFTKITDYPDLINDLRDCFENIDESENINVDYIPYTVDDFLSEAFISNEVYDKITYQLEHKKNIILQGAPGVGKTFISKRLAYSIIGFKNKDRVTLVQFHQSYSYEDFIMGYRPSGDGFKLKNGVFYDFCKKARDDEENDYFFIIDEINRGNLSKIFGELFMLLENDKRGPNNKIQLLYNDEYFYIPKNVHIIGMMNTADRSLAMLDYALRRRFSFFELKPAFDNDNFKIYADNLNNDTFNKIIELVKELNIDITNDESLGKGFVIGHSYFTNLNKDNIEYQLYNIIEFEIIPLLEEYWFDEEEKVEDWSNRLRSVLDDSNK